MCGDYRCQRNSLQLVEAFAEPNIVETRKMSCKDYVITMIGGN